MTLTAPPRIPTVDGDARALFEAARRRRHRRAWLALGIALCLLVFGVALALDRGTPGGPPSAAVPRGRGPGSVPAQSRARSQVATATIPYSPVQNLGLADGAVQWAAAGFSVYLSTDQGRRWKNVTPPIIHGQTITGVVGDMVGIGTKDLWLPVDNLVAPQLIPPSDVPSASVRVEGVERSTDGGSTWAFTPLPGCLQSCGGPPSLSFIDAEHGYAATGADQSGMTRFFSTSDGGATWVPVSTFASGGDNPSVVFSSGQDGWLVSGPTYGTYAQNGGHTTSTGGVMFRTTDGGLTWSAAPGIPPHIIFRPPTFSNPRDGVALGESTSSSRFGTAVPSVYATTDGGSTWTAHRVPVAVPANSFSAGVWMASGAAFAAVSPSDWKIYVGPELFSTGDGGRTWVRSRPLPSAAAGQVYAIAFSSSSQGMAMRQKPGCISAASGDCSSVLAGTTDGGLRWHSLKLPV